MDKTKGKTKLGSDLGEILEKRQMRSELSESEAATLLIDNTDSQIDPTRLLSRKEIKEYQKLFNRFDSDTDGYLGLEDMKSIMQSINQPQTHLQLKAMIKEVDGDGDGKISFKEFLLIYCKAKEGQLEDDSLNALAKITEINIEEVGVNGAKNFFEAKIIEVNKKSKFEEEIKAEQEEKRQQELEKKQKRQEFQQKAAIFQQVTI